MALLPDPFALLRDAYGAAEDAALAAVGQPRVRLAVTGLSRAGKTVFLTSVVANLLAAGRGHRTLPALDAAAGGRLVEAGPVPAGTEAVPRFDAEAYLAALAAEPPRWPARTDDLATLSLTLVLGREGSLARLLGPRRVTLELLDYPGEWLLDLPMLDQGFPEWSAGTLARLRTGARATEMAPFLEFVSALPDDAPAEDGLARRGHALYRDALRRLRDDHGLRLLQPGRFLNPGPRGDAPVLWFFPLPATVRGGLAELCARRHAAYRDDQRRRFFEPWFRRFDRQAVLVDVLGALHAGREAFEDTAEALRLVSEALRRTGPLAWLFGETAGRIAFCATKADHVPAAGRADLAALLAALTGAGVGEGGISAHAVAALRCTEDDAARVGDRDVAAVRGVLLDGGRAARIYPGEVPRTPPDATWWREGAFAMPVFQPPRLDAHGLSGMPHLGLDAALAALVGDLL